MAEPELPSNLIMHVGTVRSLPFEEKMRATALAGCSRLTIWPSDYFTLLEQGWTARRIRDEADKFGIRIDHLDPYVNWIDGETPDFASRHVNEDDLFRAAEGLEARSVSVVSMYPHGAVSLNRMIDGFGQFCMKAAARGLHCDLEFVPIWGLPDLETAWAIIQAVDAPNAGIMIDFWHYHRGRPDDELLRSIPGQYISAVQLNDGTASLPAGRDPLDDTRHYRRVPGEGEFRIKEVMAILRATGGLNHVGPEIFSREFDGMDAEQIAERCRAALRHAFAQDISSERRDLHA